MMSSRIGVPLWCSQLKGNHHLQSSMARPAPCQRTYIPRSRSQSRLRDRGVRQRLCLVARHKKQIARRRAHPDVCDDLGTGAISQCAVGGLHAYSVRCSECPEMVEENMMCPASLNKIMKCFVWPQRADYMRVCATTRRIR